MREYRDAHPLLCHYAQDPSMAILAPQDVCSSHQWRSSMAYSLIKSEFNVTEQLAIPVSYTEGGFTSFALGRSSRQYTDTERTNALWLQRALLAAERRHVRTSTAPCLTDREQLIVSLLGTGRTRSSVARQLGCSARTVDKHLENTFRKLGVNTLVAALNALGTAAGCRT